MKKLILILFLVITGNVYGAEALVAIRNNDWIRGRAQDGAIIDIRPDGFEWGRKEKTRFMVIQVPDEMLEYREEVRKPLTDGKLKYVYEYWEHFDKAALIKIKSKVKDNVYIKVKIKTKEIKIKDAKNNTISDMSSLIAAE